MKYISLILFDLLEVNISNVSFLKGNEYELLFLERVKEGSELLEKCSL